MNTNDIDRIAKLNENDSEEAMLELEKVIADEDPNFALSLNNLKIDDSAVIQSTSNGVQFSPIEKKTFLIVFLNNIFDFKGNPKKVFIFWGSILVLATVLIYVQISKVWVRKSQLFIQSFKDLGVEVHSYDPINESEMFFENSRLSRNLVTLSRMVTNIKPAGDSSENPMIALELTVEGLNTEVVVEIKDREAEFIHGLLRMLEQENYESLNSEKGKLELALRMRDELNANLTKGQVRKVLYKEFVLKR